MKGEEQKLNKAYAAYLSGWMGKSIFEAWFPFLADIILGIDGDEINVVKIRDEFEERYGVRLPMDFIHQVLAIGDKNDAFSYNKQCVAVVDKIKLAALTSRTTDFEQFWGRLCSEFGAYCVANGLPEVPFAEIQEQILDSIEKYDLRVVGLPETRELRSEAFSREHLLWNKYIEECYKSHNELFDFICALSYGSILKEAIFFAGEDTQAFRGLSVYLDSPIVFALLGISDPNRVESAQNLVVNLKKAQCNIYIYNHTLNEVERILRSAKRWATDTLGYRADLASLSARHFRERRFNEQEIEALICDVAGDLGSKYGIQVDSAYFAIGDEKFQVDERELERLFIERYATLHSETISEERRKSILVDIRSMSMIYRKRRNLQANKIQQCKAIMVTTSSSLAAISRQFERARVGSRLIVPACVTSNLMGSLLWLSQPKDLMKHKRLEIMADCCRFLRPSEALRKKFVEKIKLLDANGTISKEKFFLLTTSPLMDRELVEATGGDKEMITDQTPDEVYQLLVQKIEEPLKKQHAENLCSLKQVNANEFEKRKQRWGRIIGYPMYYCLVALPMAIVLTSANLWWNGVEKRFCIAVFGGVILEGIAAAEEIHIGWLRDKIFKFATKLATKVALYL